MRYIPRHLRYKQAVHAHPTRVSWREAAAGTAAGGGVLAWRTILLSENAIPSDAKLVAGTIIIRATRCPRAMAQLGGSDRRDESGGREGNYLRDRCT